MANSTEFEGQNCSWIPDTRNRQNAMYFDDMHGLMVLYGIVCTFGAIANLVVLAAFCKSASLRNIRNSFIVNLAFSDLLLCFFTGPFTIYLSVNLYWPFGNISCKTTAALQGLNTFVSSLTLALIALDRVLLTTSPLKWRMASTAPLLCYISVWVVSLLLTLPYVLIISAGEVKSFDPWDRMHIKAVLDRCNETFPRICHENHTMWDQAPVSRLQYTIAVLAIQYLLPLFALGFAYTQIGHTIRKRGKYSTTVDEGRRLNMQQKNRKAMVLLVILVLTYAICWAPMNIYNTLVSFDLARFSQHTYLFFHLIGISSASVNPLTYGLVNDSFRSAFASLLCNRDQTGSKRQDTLRPFQRTVLAVTSAPEQVHSLMSNF